jgi:hypothetical protein
MAATKVRLGVSQSTLGTRSPSQGGQRRTGKGQLPFTGVSRRELVSVGVAGVADWPVGVCGIVATKRADHASNEKRGAGAGCVQSRSRINRGRALGVRVRRIVMCPPRYSTRHGQLVKLGAERTREREAGAGDVFA